MFRDIINGFFQGERELTIKKIQHKVVMIAVDDFTDKVRTLVNGHRKQDQRKFETRAGRNKSDRPLLKSSRLDNVEILEAEIVGPNQPQPRRKK